MGLLTWTLLPVLTLLACFSSSAAVYGCNEAVCGSLVSKCLLLESCECDMTDKSNCTCCRQCHKCLAKLYTECCSCVGMCPEPEEKHTMSPRTSTFEDLPDPIPELFDVLTEEPDVHLRWTTYTYPAHHDLLYFNPGHKSGMVFTYTDEDGKEHKIRHGNHLVGSTSMNCTVAYMSQCTSQNKCRQSCKSMGAARYRWFHQYGCCECIGSTCLDFGKSESLCHKCPLPEGEDDEEEEFMYSQEANELDGEEKESES